MILPALLLSLLPAPAAPPTGLPAAPAGPSTPAVQQESQAGGAASAGQEGAAQEGAKQAPDEDARARLIEGLAQAGVRLDLDHGVVSIPATVLVRGELLEYLLVTEGGQAHESLFLTDVRPSVLNTALLALGLEPGKNARLVDPSKASAPGRYGGGESGEPPEELNAATAATHPEVIPPEGDGLYLYAGWREDDETYFYRVDDLIADLTSGRSMRRHRWVFLGSRFVTPRRHHRPDEEGKGEAGKEAPAQAPKPIFAADLEGDVINISFFFQGNTLVTAALPECVEQTRWVGNQWLLPPREAPVEFLFSREPLRSLPDGWDETLPVVRRNTDVVKPEDGR